MATIKTIKPGGGGDFTSLASWESYAGDEDNADQWAECYSGGDLGEVAIGPGWVGTVDSTNYPKIYAAPGHFHGGHKTVGAYIEQTSTTPLAAGASVLDTPYTIIDGLRIFGSEPTRYGVKLSGVTTNAIVRNCFIYGLSGVFVMTAGAGDSSSWGVTVENNIFEYPTSSLGYSWGIGGFQFTSSYHDAVTITARNNTMNATGASGALAYGTLIATSYAPQEMTISSENNVSTNATGGDFGESHPIFASGTETVTCSNCISSDTTADDFGGADNVVSKTAASLFTDAASSIYTLAAGSSAIDAGKSTGPSTDILGTTRPQGAAYDVGAYESAGTSRVAYLYP